MMPKSYYEIGDKNNCPINIQATYSLFHCQ